MLGKKTGVLFTISSVNFELKQGNEYRAEYILRIPRRFDQFILLK